jgi:hypothetical protein
LKSEYRSAKRRRIASERQERKNTEKESNYDNDSDDDSSIRSEPTVKPPKFYEIKEGEEFIGSNNNCVNSIQNSR